MQQTQLDLRNCLACSLLHAWGDELLGKVFSQGLLLLAFNRVKFEV